LNVNVELKFIDMDLPPLEEIHRRVELVRATPRPAARRFPIAHYECMSV
jgi:hypothetical protein